MTLSRASAFAKAASDRAKFVKTSHLVTNVAIAFKSPDRASVKAYVKLGIRGTMEVGSSRHANGTSNSQRRLTARE